MKKLLLVSASSGNKGHGEVYLTNLYNLIGVKDKSVFVPKDALQDNTEINKQDIVYSYNKVSELGRSNYKKWGKISQIKRGVDRITYSLRFYNDLIKHLKKNDYDVVHVLESEYIAFRYLTKRIQKLNIKLVYTMHTPDFNLQSFSLQSLYKFLVKSLVKKSLKTTSHVVCHGDYIKEKLLSVFPSLDNKITGIVYPSSAYKTYDKASVKENLGLPLDKTIVSFLGMIRKDKKIETAIDVIKSLPNNFHLLIAGSLSDYERTEIEDLINKAGIADRTTYFLKYLSREEYEDCFMSSDIFLSTHVDSFLSASGPVSDSRSYGIPVVVPPNGQLEKYVKTYNVGEVASKHEAEEFSKACLKVNKELNLNIEKIIEVSKDLSWENFAFKHHNIYNDKNL